MDRSPREAASLRDSVLRVDAALVPHMCYIGVSISEAMTSQEAKIPLTCEDVKWGRWGLNPRPADYESAALTD